MKRTLYKLSAVAFGCVCILLCSSMSNGVTQGPVASPSVKAGFCGLPAASDPKFSYRVTVKDLMSVTNLCLEGLPQHTIKSYRIILMPLKGKMSEITNTGAALDAVFKYQVSKLKAGDTILIDSIKATHETSGKEKELPPISIELL